MTPKSLPQDVESNYSSSEVLAQLKLILSHELFNNTTVLSNFLKYIVEETLAGNLNSLKEYTIGVSGLGKKVDFNPQIDAIVRIHAGRLRRLLAEYYSGPGSQDRILIEVVKGSYVPVFSLRTSKEELPMILSPSVTEIKNVTISRIAVAVLPFRNLCADKDQQLFVDALGEEFTRVFSGSNEFAVIGHQSTLKHALHQTNLHAIGMKIKAQYIISGTVMQRGDVVRVSVGLIETDLSTQIWSKVYDFKTEGNFQKHQDRTIQDVYALLGGQFGFIVRHRATTKKVFSEDQMDFDPAISNFQFHTNFSFFNFARTQKVLEIVLQNDPSYSIAMAMLSELYLWGHIIGYPTIDNPVESCLLLAHKAKNINPHSPHASFSFLWATLYSKGSTVSIKKEIDLLLKQNPPATFEAAKLSTILVWAGNYDGIAKILERVLTEHANCPWSFSLAQALIFFQGGLYDKAYTAIDSINVTDIYLVDLMKVILSDKLKLEKESKPAAAAFLNNYTFIGSNLRAHLGNLLLDQLLINNILNAARAAGIAVRR